MLQDGDGAKKRAQKDYRQGVGAAGAGVEGGEAFAGGQAGGAGRAAVYGGAAVVGANRQSVAGFAEGAGEVAQRLHALSAPGGQRGVGAALARSANRGDGGGKGGVHRLHHGACASTCGRSTKKNRDDAALGRSRGGLTTKIHAATLDENRSVVLQLTPGQASDCAQFDSIYDALPNDNVLEAAALDKGYDADRIRERLALDGVEPVIPGRSNRRQSIPYDRSRYARRNLVERFFNKLKQFRRISTRYEKHAFTFLAMLHLVSAFISIKN